MNLRIANTWMSKMIVFVTTMVVLAACSAGEQDRFEEEVVKEQANQVEFSLTQSYFVVSEDGGTLEIELPAEGSYEVSIPVSDQEWIATSIESRASKNSLVKLSVKNNKQAKERKSKVTIRETSSAKSETLVVEQPGVEATYYAEKEVLTIQKASKGNGIDIVVMGDGFLADDLSAGGRYESLMREAADHFFSVYPYSAYKEYFNVYMVAASSAEEGVSGDTKAVVDNRFGTIYGAGTSISCDDAKVKEYAQVIPGFTTLNKLTVILVLNSKKYAGTCVMSKSGFSIAMCPVAESSDYRRTFKAIVTHEAGGHGFPKLMDEYFGTGTISSAEVSTLKSWQKSGLAANVDFTASKSEVIWSDFFNYSQYANEVGVYEGGYTYKNGVWRSSENSCMKDNSNYYNVVSRWAIVKKIHEMAGTSYSFEQFLKDDQIPAQTRSAAASESFEQLGSPVLVD